MLKETIFLYHTPIEKAIAYLVSSYGFIPARNQENTFASNYIVRVPSPSLDELGVLLPIKLEIEKEGRFDKITLNASYRSLNIIFTIITCMTIGLTLLIFSWPYVFLFLLMPLILYFFARLRFQASFF